MASWNPTPTISGANWSGNQTLATKNQLLSSISGLYADLNDFTFSTISSVGTLTATNWISTPVLYVSDIQGTNFAVDASGIFVTNQVSAQTASFGLTIVSTFQFNVTNTIKPQFNITFDLGFGQIIGGALAGLGAVVGGAIAGTGAIVGGAETGLATLINPRNQTFINNTTFETINTGTQLQISTLGNAYPAYSTIMRWVSSSGEGNVIPGREIFVSTLFYPGQIAIRSVSDPYSIITGDTNIASSTIQSFGQWVPLTGLEPEDIIANSISVNTISSGQAFSGLFYGNQGAIYDMNVNTLTLPDSNIGSGTKISYGYDTPAKFTLGSLGEADILGSVNYLWIQSDQDIVFSKPGDTGTIAIAGSISLGANSGESYLNFSTVNANIVAENATITNLTVTNFSTINTTTSFNTLSTAVVETDRLYSLLTSVSSITPFRFFSTNYGYTDNKVGPYTIVRNDTLLSTTYNQISSITQNILQSQFNVGINTQTSNIAAPYQVISPSNVEQWASTCFVWNNATINGGVQIDPLLSWSSPTATITSGTFDLLIQGTQPSGVQPYRVVQDRDPGLYPSTFVTATAHPQGYSQTYRFTLPANSNGWWQMTSPAPPPYQTINSNALSIWQDINDTFIEGTDRLHLKAGDIFLDGTTNFGDIGTLTAGNVFTTNLTASNATVGEGFFSTLTSLNYVSTPQLLSPYVYNGPINSLPIERPLNINYQISSTDFPNNYALNLASRGWNAFNSQNVSEWNNSAYYIAGDPGSSQLPQVILGETFSNAGGFVVPFTPYTGKFWINNATSGTTPSFIYVQAIKPGGQGVLSTIGIATRLGTGYNLVETPDGQNWTVTSNVPSPFGVGGFTYSNSYNVTVGASNTTLQVLQPYIEVVPSKQTFALKETHYTEQIRVWTNASPSYQSREAGFEYNTYFDGSIVFTGTESDAVNLIRNPLSNLLYPCCGWTPMVWGSRIRTQSLGIQGFDFDGIVVLIGGAGTGDFVWASARYLNVNGSPPGNASIRENYLMIPVNYTTFNNFFYP